MPKGSGFIPTDIIEDIRQRADIAQIIGDSVTLKRVGSRLVGLCPFHQDSKPSFYVDSTRGAYKCFGCGAGGDVFRWVMETQRLTFAEAVRHLGERVGVEVPETGGGPARPRGYRDGLYAANEGAVSFFREMLQHPEIGRAPREYLRQRGLTRSIMEDFELGFAPGDGSALVKHLQKRGASLQDAQAVGLIVKRDRDDGYFDFFRNRLMCPVRGQTGKAVAFSGRLLDGEGAKYFNSTESEVFKKHRTFYAMHLAYKNISKRDEAIVCEGNFDVIALHQHGFEHAVAALGTAFSESHADIMERFTKNVVFVFDGDPAGRKATVKLVDFYAQRDYQPKAVVLPEGEDPDSFLKAQGPEKLRELFSEAPALIDFAIDETYRQFGDSEEDLARATSAACALVARVTNPIRRGLLAKSLAVRVSVAEEAIRTQIDRAQRGGRAPILRLTKTSERHMPKLGRDILATLLHHPQVKGGLDRDTVLHALPDGPARMLGERLWRVKPGADKVTAENLLMPDDEDDVRDLATALLLSEPPCETKAAHGTIVSAISNREKQNLRLEIESVRKLRDEALEAGNKVRADQLEYQLHSLRKQLRMIRI